MPTETKTTKAPRRIIKTGATKTTRPAKPEAKAEAKPAKAPLVHFHRESGLSHRYAGASDPINANRRVAIKLSAYQRTAAQLTERTLALFDGARTKYGSKPFPARGLDNAVAAMLINAGLVSTVAGTGRTVADFGDGHSGFADGEKPLMLTVTKAGATYGKATA